MTQLTRVVTRLICLVVHPMELEILSQAAHPAVLIIAHFDALQLLLRELYGQLEADLLSRPHIWGAGHHHALAIGDQCKGLAC